MINEGDVEATVPWQGLRLDNRYDGTHETQAPIPPLQLPDRVSRPGRLLYHPHIREDFGLEMDLCGNIRVVSAEADYWPPAHPGAGAHAR